MGAGAAIYGGLGVERTPIGENAAELDSRRQSPGRRRVGREEAGRRAWSVSGEGEGVVSQLGGWATKGKKEKGSWADRAKSRERRERKIPFSFYFQSLRIHCQINFKLPFEF